MTGKRLGEKVALITGASRGIGAAIAKHMARCGARVVLASRKLEGLQAVAAEIEAEGGEAAPLTCHTGDPEQIDALLGQAVARFGQVDILVNNAATNPYFGPTLETHEAAWDKTFDVNLKGYFRTSRALARHLTGRSAGGGIVNISSVVAGMGAPLNGVYAMTKAAVVSLTKCLAMELGPQGIRVNAIAPGLIETHFAKALTENEPFRQSVIERSALKRLGRPEDIAGAATFLASDEAAYVTGTVLTIDGGWTVS